jgi:hypothetical protein
MGDLSEKVHRYLKKERRSEYIGVAAVEVQPGDVKNMWDRLQIKVGGKYVHVELFFEKKKKNEDKKCFVGVSIYKGETVRFEERDYSRAKGQTFLYIPVTNSEKDKVYKWLRNQEKMQNKQYKMTDGFNYRGMYMSTFPRVFQHSGGGKYWFCSELLVSALHTIGRCSSLRSQASTPTRIMQTLAAESHYQDGHPVRTNNSEYYVRDSKGAKRKVKDKQYHNIHT